MSISFFVTMLEMIGSAAFAVSGVVVAKTKKMAILHESAVNGKLPR